MNDTDTNIYDAVLYHGLAYHQTHPDHLATLALLSGMTPAPVAHCRVLELGCGNGSNLIPMAFDLPDSTFVGVDLAAHPISIGNETARKIGLENLTMHQLDLMDLPADWGAFDYIIAHGLYSWVPREVQDRLLELCDEHLAPEGVAYVSYNTYPGWHQIEATRQMMLYHVQNIDDPVKRARQGRALMKFLLDGQPKVSDFRPFLEREVQRIARFPDWLLLHDLLAEINTPCYFHVFAEHAMQHGLQYVGDADYALSHARAFPPHVADTLNQLCDSQLLQEQYLDFLRGRPFRQSLLCRQDVALDHSAAPERLKALYIAAPIREASEDSEGAGVAFEGVKGRTVETPHPFTQAVCRHLGACWPGYVSFEELLDAARTHAGSEATKEKDTHLLAEMLTNFYTDNFIELHVRAPRLARTVSARPVASPVACVQLQNSSIVPTLLHTTVQLDATEQQLLPLLDGTRDLDTLEGLIDSEEALEDLLDGLVRHGLLLA